MLIFTNEEKFPEKGNHNELVKIVNNYIKSCGQQDSVYQVTLVVGNEHLAKSLLLEMRKNKNVFIGCYSKLD